MRHPDGALCAGVGAPEGLFRLVDRQAHFSFLRCVHYPAPTERPATGRLRAGAHTDYGDFTLVNFSDAPGGLAGVRQGRQWVDVQVVGDSFESNLGDLMEVWTNDPVGSTLDRVIVADEERLSAGERLSLVYFHEPNWHVVASALPTCMSADRPAKYEPITAGEHNRRKVMRQQMLTA